MSLSDTFVVRRLDQAKLIADPFRLRVLLAFAEPRAIRAAAAMLGEPPSRLYRHVHALRAAGLLRIVGRRRVRGTVERSYQTVARRFEIDPGLFATGSRRKASPLTAAVSLLDRTRDELAAALLKPIPPMVVRALLRARPADVERLRAALVATVERFGDTTDDAGAEEWVATIALYRSG